MILILLTRRQFKVMHVNTKPTRLLVTLTVPRLLRVGVITTLATATYQINYPLSIQINESFLIDSYNLIKAKFYLIFERCVSVR